MWNYEKRDPSEPRLKAQDPQESKGLPHGRSQEECRSPKTIWSASKCDHRDQWNDFALTPRSSFILAQYSMVLPVHVMNQNKIQHEDSFFLPLLRNRSWSNVAKHLMLCQPESTPKMSWPHKTHLALLAGPYLVTNIESDEWSLSMKSEFFQSFLTYEQASLPACQSLQGWCR